LDLLQTKHEMQRWANKASIRMYRPLINKEIVKTMFYIYIYFFSFLFQKSPMVTGQISFENSFETLEFLRLVLKKSQMVGKPF